MAAADVCYLVFDLESVADGKLIARLKYPGEDISPVDAINRYRAELLEKYDSDFIPYTYHLPLVLVVGKVSSDFRLKELVALDDPEFRPHMVTEHFWRGWDAYRRPTLVTFNGRTYDLPVLELSAFRYGISVPGWFNVAARSFEQLRNRYNLESHIDLHELLTNYGSTRFSGGLNLASNLLGKPGKMEVQGHMVQDIYHDGRVREIADYCHCDVLDTYFVFLRSRVLLGQLSLDQEQAIVAETKTWLECRAGESPAYRTYLESWSDWENPWQAAGDLPAH